MDRSEYMSVDADYWYDRGEEDERAKIVAWLRNRMTDTIMFLDPVPNIDDMANDIEAGEHLK